MQINNEGIIIGQVRGETPAVVLVRIAYVLDEVLQSSARDPRIEYTLYGVMLVVVAFDTELRSMCAAFRMSSGYVFLKHRHLKRRMALH